MLFFIKSRFKTEHYFKMKKGNVLFRNCGNKTFRLKKSHPPLFKPKLFAALDMHLQMDSVALKIEGFFLADSCFRGEEGK